MTQPVNTGSGIEMSGNGNGKHRVGRSVECNACPLAKIETFRSFTKKEVDFISGFKRGELTVEQGATILVEGTNSAHLFTILSGWGYRYKTLEDGRRQILNYVFPGDFVGLQGSILEEMQHSVEALSDMVLCVFERDKLSALFQNYPQLAFDLTWIASQEEQILDEHLLSVGQRNARERAAYLLAHIHERARAVGLFKETALISPLTQQQVADTLGLSLVHTNKTLKKLGNEALIKWEGAGCRIKDIEALKRISGWDGMSHRKRPFI